MFYLGYFRDILARITFIILSLGQVQKLSEDSSIHESVHLVETIEDILSSSSSFNPHNHTYGDVPLHREISASLLQ